MKPVTFSRFPAITAIFTLSLLLGLAACSEQPNKQAESRPKVEAVQPIYLPTNQPSEPALSISKNQHIALEEVVVTAQKRKHALSSTPMAVSTVGFQDHQRYSNHELDRENYQHFTANGVKLVREEPVSTFSIDVDTAGYSNIRQMLLREGRLPPKDAVKLEEMINYLSYNYPTPESPENAFSVSTEMAAAPWNNNRQLLQIGLKGFQPLREESPAANLVFLIDVSGSMQSPYKLALVKRSLRLLVQQLDADDRIALVVYAGAAGLVLDSTSADQKATIMAAIDGLQAGGSTNGGAGIQLAYSVARQHYIKDGINRVLIASDGDMNVGTTNIEALKSLIEEKRKSGIALTTLGFGSGNYNFALMEQLADVGNGNAAYIDSMLEAQKVLVNELQSTLLTIAKDVKIQVEFNPALVAEYRLIGYENRLLNREDFRNDKVDAGEIGAGHTVTALYEVTLKDNNAKQIPTRRYGNLKANINPITDSEELAFVRLRYKQPGDTQSIEINQPVLLSQTQHDLTSASNNLRFAAAVAGFGQLLRGGKYTGQWSYQDVITTAREARGPDLHGYRAEMISMLELAQSLSTNNSNSAQQLSAIK